MKKDVKIDSEIHRELKLFVVENRLKTLENGISSLLESQNNQRKKEN
jgi:hypothetical protein